MNMRQNHTKTQGSWQKLSDAARFLDVSEITLRRRIKSGQIPCEFQHGKYFVFISDDESFEPGPFSEPEPVRTARAQPHPLPKSSLPQKQPREMPRALPKQQTPEPDYFAAEFEHRFEEEPYQNLPRAHNRYDNTIQRHFPKEELSNPLSAEVQQLRRMLEDQQSLIAMLEEAVETLQHQFSTRMKFQ